MPVDVTINFYTPHSIITIKLNLIFYHTIYFGLWRNDVCLPDYVLLSMVLFKIFLIYLDLLEVIMDFSLA